MVSASDSFVSDMTIMRAVSAWPPSATVDSCFAAHQYSVHVADDEPAHPKGI